MLKRFAVLYICCLLSCAGTAQLKNANELYESYKYARAIPLYEKVLKKKEHPLALQNLANCYRITKNYAKAGEIYARVVKLPDIPPITHFYYGYVLLCNNKVEEARREFLHYSELEPESKLARLQLKNMEFLRLLMNQPPVFDIKNMKSLNSEKAEFSPVFYKDGIAFVSDREADLVNFSKFDLNSQPYLSIFYSRVKNADDTASVKITRMPSVFNSSFHDGPVSFSADFQTAVFTRVSYTQKKTAAYINRPKLFITEEINGRYSKPVLFPFIKGDSSFAHPALSANGQTLIFASDMQGGFGGFDLYISTRIGEIWSEPQNLGSEINTPSDELFPYLRKDGTLYFSSRGHSGFGGLDIFYATSMKNGKWADVTNMGTPVNSYTDDFGILFNDDNKSGYFSSDRADGKGKDDIYSFRINQKLVSVAGKILNSKNADDAAENLRVFLLTEGGLPLNMKTTGQGGVFRFENLPADKKYMLSIDESDPDITHKEKYYMANRKGEIVRRTVVNEEGGKFTFENLPVDTLDAVNFYDNVFTSGNLLVGEGPSKPLANIYIKLMDRSGNFIETSRTNAFGGFVLKNVPPEGEYILRVDESDPGQKGMKAILTSPEGKELKATLIGNNGSFRFEFLKSEQSLLKEMEVDDDRIKVNLKAMLLDSNGSPLANREIILVNEKGEVLQRVKTDEKGSFYFTNLPADGNYFLSLESSDDPVLAGLDKLLLADTTGKILKTLLKKNEKFNFRVLPSNFFSMQEIFIDDPWLKVLDMNRETIKPADSIIIIEAIYYNLDEWIILPEAKKTLDKVAGIMKKYPQIRIQLRSHTDSRASREYNLILSQQRAKAAVKYIVSLGVNPKNISGKGYGEEKLINSCRDGVECSEEEHALNRRTEFKVIRK